MPAQRRSWNWQAPEQSAHLEQQPDRSSNWTCATSTAGARALPHWIRRCGRHAEAGRDGDGPDGGARHSGEGAAEKSQPARCAHLHWKCPSYPDIYRKIQVLIWCPVARTLQIWRQKGFECTHARTHARTQTRMAPEMHAGAVHLDARDTCALHLPPPWDRVHSLRWYASKQCWGVTPQDALAAHKDLEKTWCIVYGTRGVRRTLGDETSESL
jgi:hypothetical protein